MEMLGVVILIAPQAMLGSAVSTVYPHNHTWLFPALCSFYLNGFTGTLASPTLALIQRGFPGITSVNGDVEKDAIDGSTDESKPSKRKY